MTLCLLQLPITNRVTQWLTYTRTYRQLTIAQLQSVRDVLMWEFALSDSDMNDVYSSGKLLLVYIAAA